MINNKHFKISQEYSSMDSVIDVKLENVPPLTEVKVIVKTLSEYYCINAPLKVDTTSIWGSENVYISNTTGEINLNTDFPIEGHYTGACKMGCLSFLKLYEQREAQEKKDINQIPVNNCSSFKLEAYIDNHLIDHCIIRRFYLEQKSSYENIALGEGQGRYFKPDKGIDLPAIIVLSGSEGGIEKAQAIAQLLSNYGYATLAIGYFKLSGTSDNLSKIPIEIIGKAVAYLKSRKEIDSERIGIFGRSKGAELALLAGNIYPELKCIALNSPTNIVFEGLKGKMPSKESSWTHRSLEIPYFKFNLKKYLLSKIKNEYYPNLDQEKEYEIPVDNIKEHILLICSVQDEVWDSYKSCILLKNRLENNNNNVSVTIDSFQNSGHMLTIPFQPNNRYSKRNNVSVMQDTYRSWLDTVNFFKKYL